MNHETSDPKLAPARQPVEPRVAVAPRTVLVSSEQLFAGAAEVQINHRGARYRLKQTSLGKLILTK
jgi:hemin uptake protein HemP